MRAGPPSSAHFGKEFGTRKLRRSFVYVGSLRSFLALDDLEFHRVTLLQALVSLGRDRAVVYENIRTAIPTYETVAFRIVKPLNRTFQTFHLRPLGTP